MGRGIYEKQNCLAEYQFQAVNTHTTATNNVMIRTGAKGVEIEIKGDIFRKTSSTGSGVEMLVEMFELTTPSTSGTAYAKYFAVKRDRESNRELPLIVRQNVTFTPNPAGIMLRERSIADKVAVDRSGDINLAYSLKPNTDYVILSTVVTGTDYNVESTIYGVVRELE